MRKSYFKRGCALCLAVALVVSGGLYAASDRSLMANEENNVYQETELSSAENGPETVVQELEVPDEDTNVDTDVDTNADAEGSDKADAGQESTAAKQPEAVVTTDGNGGYELTPIAENETPLANLNLGDHHCCILHFLLMALAFLVLCFYTRSRKKHQKKIFELREELELEKKRRGLTDTEDAGEERK